MGPNPVRMTVVGWPVDHSLSPALWRGMARRKGLALEYGRCPVAPADDTAWDAVWGGEVDAFNVTTPLKERAATRCDVLSDEARAVDAVNTVVRADDRWVGHCTDGYGVVQSLLEAGSDVEARAVVVLGTGGAGRAAARAIAARGARVTLVTRTPERSPPGCDACELVGWSDLERVACEIVVNATPLGCRPEDPLPPIPYAKWCHGTTVLDLNYQPRTTAFLDAAQRAGADTLGGVAVLVHQACAGAAIVFGGDAAEYTSAFWAAESESRDQAGTVRC